MKAAALEARRAYLLKRKLNGGDLQAHEHGVGTDCSGLEACLVEAVLSFPHVFE